MSSLGETRSHVVNCCRWFTALDGNRPHSLGVAATSKLIRYKGMLLLISMDQGVSETVFPNPSLSASFCYPFNHQARASGRSGAETLKSWQRFLGAGWISDGLIHRYHAFLNATSAQRELINTGPQTCPFMSPFSRLVRNSPYPSGTISEIASTA